MEFTEKMQSRRAILHERRMRVKDACEKYKRHLNRSVEVARANLLVHEYLHIAYCRQAKVKWMLPQQFHN